ncbi:MAG: RagB/SusD family nutrient uptake outer membrane protein [Tannerellaceae bacterium]|nr:RagB/SusD family nutrient uptake outer membrane protein [Tannerellaceae bacterium]
MKKIIYLLASVLVLTSCEDFLDTENYTKKTTGNWPASYTDAQQLLTGVYATLSEVTSNAQDSYYYMAELAADERFGGGGENDKQMQAYDKLMNFGADMMLTFWEGRYKGIYRANNGLETVGNWEDAVTETQKNQVIGELHFLRGFFYHELVEAFENIPLILTAESEDMPQADPDLVYGQIAYDLKQAIELIPQTKAPSDGHATKWDAEALMARVFLFYTGFYNQTSMPLGNGEGENVGTITQDQVITWLEDCINNSGHDLVPDFRELWSYTNPYTAPYYSYANGLSWVEDGSNPEQMFSIKYSFLADWNDSQIGYSNQYALHMSLRHGNGYENTFPFGRGWGAGPVNSRLWNEWTQAEPNDIRRKASILDATDTEECSDYLWGQDTQMEETGYWQKKIINIQAYDGGERYDVFGYPMYGAQNDIALGSVTDLILIRFSDVLLMHSELKKDVTGINRVRTRAGLNPISAYSDEALRNERRWELCFEGRRWADIRRWGIVTNVLDSQEGVAIKNNGVDATIRAFGGGYSARYNATRGFYKIPESQVTLSQYLVQNPGWGSEAEFAGW